MNTPRHPARTPQPGPRPTATRPPAPPAIEGFGVYLTPDAGALRGYASVKIGPLVIHKFRVTQQDGQPPCVLPPQEVWTDSATGERRFKTLVDVPAEWKQPLTDAVVAAWRAECARLEGGSR